MQFESVVDNIHDTSCWQGILDSVELHTEYYRCPYLPFINACAGIVVCLPDEKQVVKDARTFLLIFLFISSVESV